jgi:uncharacterized Tic20 family protein
VYVITNDDFARSNARNVPNWWLFVFIAGIAIAVIGFGLGAIVDVSVILAALLVVVVSFLDLGFSVWATVEAAGGETWKYPLAPDLF